jgi:pimeloyl-ACP methyl ester carboxylesterase
MERTIQTPDGRTLAVEDSGDPDGRPVLVHMGTPNSRHLDGPNVADAAARGLRLICYDRPGYGGSDPQPGRTVADCAADARAICAAWGSAGSGCGASPVAGRTSLRARRCCPTWSWQRPRSPRRHDSHLTLLAHRVQDVHSWLAEYL